jgi:hypothetical protein
MFSAARQVLRARRKILERDVHFRPSLYGGLNDAEELGTCDPGAIELVFLLIAVH